MIDVINSRRFAIDTISQGWLLTMQRTVSKPNRTFGAKTQQIKVIT